MSTNRARKAGAVVVAAAIAGLVLAGCGTPEDTVAATSATGQEGRPATSGYLITTTSGTSPDLTQPPTTPDPSSMPSMPGPTVGPPPPTFDDSRISPNGPPTTHPDPNVPVPMPPPTRTIPAIGADPAMIDCGTVDRAVGWPTTFVMSPEPFRCLADALTAGTPARLVDRHQTDGDGGSPLVITYDVLGPGRLRVTEDATEAADRPQALTVSMCTGATAGYTDLTTTGCEVVPA